MAARRRAAVEQARDVRMVEAREDLPLVAQLAHRVAGRDAADDLDRDLLVELVVGALGVSALLIGPEIDPGVPWTHSLGDDRPVALALKSGNFGGVDFFSKAWRVLA